MAEIKDYKKEYYPLNNVVLYSKGWYKTSNDIWADIKYMLDLDGYCPGTKNDILTIMIVSFDNYNRWRKENHMPNYDLLRLFSEIEKQKRIFDYKIDEQEAFLRTILSYYSCTSMTDIKLRCPIYNKKNGPHSDKYKSDWWANIEAKKHFVEHLDEDILFKSK